MFLMHNYYKSLFIKRKKILVEQIKSVRTPLKTSTIRHLIKRIMILYNKSKNIQSTILSVNRTS